MPELEAHCWHPCNACRHVHHGHSASYTCPICSCHDTFRPESAGVLA